MQHDNASFWADIKNFEERLSRFPDSYVFARLSEVYLKVGLLDDALYTARQGVDKYPGYVAGQKSLALACHAKGLLEESCQALEKVVTAIPEDREAQYLLGRLFSMNGNDNAAEKVYRTILEFYPDDVECRLELEVLERSKTTSQMEASHGSTIKMGADVPTCEQSDNGFVKYGEDADEADEIIEDIEIIEMDESDLVEAEESELSEIYSAAAVSLPHDPLSTVTLADLYVQQGFIDKALDIYRDILADDPGNSAVRSRIAELENNQPTDYKIAQDLESSEDASDGLMFEVKTAAISLPPVQGEADNAVSILEGWLDNIRRMKACR